MILSTALRGNAVFTALCAAICLGAADWVAAHIGLPSRIWVIGLGIMLASYVPILLIAAARSAVWLAKTIIALDWGFVAIAAVFLATHWTKADAAGTALVIVPTLLVALFAWLQMRGLGAMQREART